MILRLKNNVALIALTTVLALSCSSGAEHDPQDNGENDFEVQAVSIAYLKSVWEGHPVVITDPYSIKGRVMSSDKAGNFRKSIFVEDETGGIEVLLDRNELYRDFPLYSYVEVRLTGLTLGAYGRFVQLGAAGGETGYQVSHIADKDIVRYLAPFEPESVVEVNPASLNVEELTTRHLGTLVAVSGVQFSDEESGQTWSEADQATERTLINRNGSTLKVRTLSGAAFASHPLPDGSGFLEGILCAFNGEYNLRVIDTHYTALTEERF